MEYYSPDQLWKVVICDNVLPNDNQVVKTILIYKKRVDAKGYELFNMIPLC